MRYFVFWSLLIAFITSCNQKFIVLEPKPTTYNFTTEPLLEDPKQISSIETFYNSGTEGFFNGKDSISIYYKVFTQKKNNKGAILISTGRTEAAIKYKELIYDLYYNGYSIYILDHRGQGFSGRMTQDSDMGFIDNFQYYIEDVKFFYEHYLKPDQPKKIYLLAHSMGGAIGMSYLAQFPYDFNAAAFSSPMLGLKKPICTTVNVLAGKKPKYAPGQTKYHMDTIDFKNNKLTGSKIRFHRMVQEFSTYPEARLGGATYQWLEKSCKQFEILFTDIENITTPFILFSAEEDAIVATRAHQKFIKKAKEANKDCKAYTIPNAKHELLIELDTYRSQVLNHTLLFFEAY